MSPVTARLIDSSTTDQRLHAMRCSGRKRDGSSCNKLLSEVLLTAGSIVRIKCGHCNELNVFTGRAGT